MSKVLVTGLGVGEAFDFCESCQLNFSWLITNPSILLWADKICLPKNAYNTQVGTNISKIDPVINMILQKANDMDMLEVIDVATLYGDQQKEIYDMVKEDEEAILSKYSGTVQKGSEEIPEEIKIEKYSYCGPYVASIYASMKIAEDIDANCLFNDRDYTYLKYRYGTYSEAVNNSQIIESFSEIFSLAFPNELVVHNYATTSEARCTSCVKISNCKKNYIKEIEAATNEYLEWRNYDEIYRAKEELEKIIRSKQDFEGDIKVADIKKEFEDRQRAVNKVIKKRFPMIRRWTNLTTFVAAPVTIVTAATGNTAAAIVSASLGSLAQATNEYLNYYESKKRWVGFFNQKRTSQRNTKE